MKKLHLSLLLSFFSVFAYSQEEETDTLGWTFGGVGGLNFSQVSLYQWSAGGEPSMSGAALLNLYANHRTLKSSWENSLDLGYGIIRQGRDENVLTKKSNDRIEFNSLYGRNISEKWFYSGLLNFRTQFTEGYNYPNDEDVISDFFAPAYLTVSAGANYKASEKFQAFISPLAGKFTIVLNDSLSAAGEFGVEPGEKFRAELGAYLKLAYQTEILENVELASKIDFFSNYLDNPQNIDINFELLLSMKVNEYLAATISVMAIYDDDVTLLQSDDTMGPGIQIKEVFGLGLSYSF